MNKRYMTKKKTGPDRVIFFPTRPVATIISLWGLPAGWNGFAEQSSMKLRYPAFPACNVFVSSNSRPATLVPRPLKGSKAWLIFFCCRKLLSAVSRSAQ